MILCYIDPGTGSMLFSIVIGLVTMLYFLGKALLIKLKFVLTGGKATSSKKHYPLIIYQKASGIIQFLNLFLLHWRVKVFLQCSTHLQKTILSLVMHIIT